MKIRIVLLFAVAVAFSMSGAPAFAKTVKECTAEWRADKAGMQARGTTEKAYIEQCRGAPEQTAAPVAKPAEAAPPPAPRQATANDSKSAKECTAEWRAAKADMQARGVTERAYVEQCRGGVAPAASAPAPRPTATAPSAPTQTNMSPSKTAKECIAEWRADKAGMQARGVTQKAYVEQCRVGGAVPSAATPEPKPAAAAPTSPSPAAPSAREAAPAPAPQRPASTTTAAPSSPQQPATPQGTATLETGQFTDEGSARARCPTDTVVWVALPSKVYHFAGTKNYGTTKRGAFMCEKEAIAAENRASKTETHP